jgi:hypothetical protein
MNATELAPLIYTTWTTGAQVNLTEWQDIRNNATTTNRTVVDNLFGWTKEDYRKDYPPVFPKLPQEYNTIMNHTSFGWGREAIYWLGAGGPVGSRDMTGIYSLCQMKMTLSTKCTTQCESRVNVGKKRR